MRKAFLFQTSGVDEREEDFDKSETGGFPASLIALVNSTGSRLSSIYGVPVRWGIAGACLMACSCGIHTECSDGGLYSAQMYRKALLNGSGVYSSFALLKVRESVCGPAFDVCLDVKDIRKAIEREYDLDREDEVMEVLVNGREHGFFFRDPKARALVRRRYGPGDLAEARSRYKDWSYMKIENRFPGEGKDLREAMSYATAHYLLQRGFDCAHGPWIGKVVIQAPSG